MDLQARVTLKALWDVSLADGHFAEAEREVMADILSSMGLTAADLIAAGTSPEPTPSLAAIFPDFHSRVQLLDKLLSVGLADGIVAPEELEHLKKVAELLELSDEQFENCAIEALERHQQF